MAIFSVLNNSGQVTSFSISTLASTACSSGTNTIDSTAYFRYTGNAEPGLGEIVYADSQLTTLYTETAGDFTTNAGILPLNGNSQVVSC